MDPRPEEKRAHLPSRQLVGGIFLILIGLAILLGHWFDLGAYTVLLLGSAMLVWGCLSHRTGWIIPGGVLSGIGLGILALEGPWKIPPVDDSAVFLLCFSFGWFLITLLTALYTCTQWWALIPGGIMAVLGGTLLVTNGNLPWADFNLIYAAILILIGLSLLIYRGRGAKR